MQNDVKKLSAEMDKAYQQAISFMIRDCKLGRKASRKTRSLMFQVLNQLALFPCDCSELETKIKLYHTSLKKIETELFLQRMTITEALKCYAPYSKNMQLKPLVI